MSNRRRHDGNRENPDKSKCLGVFGLSLYTTERELEKEFGKFGPLEKCQVVLDGHSGRSRGFAFIYFETLDDSCEARKALNGIELDGRQIRVDFSITKRAHTPTPGMYMGRPTREGRDDRRRSPPRRRSPAPAPAPCPGAPYCNPFLGQFCPGGIACPNCGSNSCQCPC